MNLCPRVQFDTQTAERLIKMISICAYIRRANQAGAKFRRENVSLFSGFHSPSAKPGDLRVFQRGRIFTPPGRPVAFGPVRQRLPGRPEVGLPARLLPNCGGRHRLRMPPKRPAQIAGHDIDHHGRQHQNHADPDAPVTVHPFPVGIVGRIGRLPVGIFLPELMFFLFVHRAVIFCCAGRPPFTPSAQTSARIAFASRPLRPA